MATETITWIPAAGMLGQQVKLPDAETNVLLALADGDTCEGFLDGEWGGYPVWRDVTGAQITQAVVMHWADMPAGPGVTA